MSYPPDGDGALLRVLYVADSAGVALTLGIVVLSSFIEAIKPPKQRASSPSLRKIQLILSGGIVILTATHSVLYAQHVKFSDKPDPALVSILFTMLSWTMLTISLLERSTIAGSPQYLGWTASLGSHVAEFVAISSLRQHRQDKVRLADLVVLTIRIAAVLALLVSTVVFQFCSSKSELALSEDETQPLLDAEANTSAIASSGKSGTGDKKSKDDKADDDDDDEDEDEKPDAKARKELRQRPFRKYIASFKIFIPHLRPRSVRQWLYIGVISVCIAIQRVMNVMIPWSTGNLINNLQNAEVVPWKPLALYLVLYTISSAGILSTTKQLARRRFENKLKESLVQFCYTHVMHLSADYHDSKGSQRLTRIIDRGDIISSFFTMIWFELVPQVSDLFISLGVIAWLFGGYLCFIVATTITFFAYANAKFVKQKAKIRRTYIDASIEQWQHMWESMHSWATISHFNRVDHERGVSKERTKDMFDKAVVTYDFEAVAQMVRQSIICSGFVAASIVAIYQVIYSSRGVGDFVMLVTYWSQVMAPVKGLISLINDSADQLVDAELMMLLLERVPTVRNSPEAKDLDFRGGAVEFEDVSFSYDGERVVSKDISFRIDAGQTVAIVGETGGGKSTLLKLLFRFYDPTKGIIRIDGQDIRDLRTESFRELIGFVPQDPAMFQRSVLDNIRYSKLDATDDEVIEACKGAVLHDKIMTFTKGYKQVVGERGSKLSGGEQQRLAVARAILKRPKMLLLDEATSSVDSLTETKIHECLKTLCKGRTTFIIAHRLSTILHADLILVVKNGQLVEQGSHRQLIKQVGGAYKELWEAQIKLQSSEDDDTVEGHDGDTNTTTITTTAAAAAAVTEEENDEDDNDEDKETPSQGTPTNTPNLIESEEEEESSPTRRTQK